MFARIILFVLGLLLTQPGHAGPWPRPEGEQFLSVSVEIEPSAQLELGEGLFGALYYERGLRNDLTLGLDLGSEVDDISKAIAFLRWPVGREDGRDRLALEFGIGSAEGDLALRPGISWGRGLTRGTLPGWLAVDSRVLLRDGFDALLETDFTFGLKPSDKTMWILQLQTGVPRDGDGFAKIAPSWVRQIRPGRQVEFGLVGGIAGESDLAIKLGLWRAF